MRLTTQIKELVSVGQTEIEKPEDMNWDICPIATIEFDDTEKQNEK